MSRDLDLSGAPGRASERDDVGSVLVRRLEQLRDEHWMKPVFSAALAQMMPPGAKVIGYEIEYCKIKPNRDINLVARVRLENAGSETRRLSCTVFPSAEACRLGFAADQARPPAESTLQRLEAQGYRRPEAQLDDPAMIVRAFPIDPVLPGLAPATDFEQMAPIFARHLEPCLGEGLMPSGFDCEILHYKPRCSCTLHYTIALERPGSREGARQCRIFGKVARDDRGQHKYDVLEAAWRASLDGGQEWRAAKPLAYVPEWHLLLQEAVPGRVFQSILLEETPDNISPDQFQQVTGHLERIVRALHALQSAPPGRGAAKTFARLHAEQEQNLLYLSGSEPGLAAELAAIRAELVCLERESPVNPLVFCHGDLAPGNVLVDGENVGIIDFDKAGAAEPAHDIAYFLTHLWSFGIRHPRRMRHVKVLAQHVRDLYLSLAPEVSSERLALYEGLDFASYVLRNFRKQSHQAKWLTWTKWQVEAGWDRVRVAAGRKGAR